MFPETSFQKTTNELLAPSRPVLQTSCVAKPEMFRLKMAQTRPPKTQQNEPRFRLGFCCSRQVGTFRHMADTSPVGENVSRNHRFTAKGNPKCFQTLARAVSGSTSDETALKTGNQMKWTLAQDS